MPQLNHAPHPEQGSLFIVNEHTGTLVAPSEHSATDIDASQKLPVDPNLYPSVNLLERNAHFQNLLKRLGVMSRTTGLQIASTTGLRRGLEERYDNVDRVVGNAAERSNQQFVDAKVEFAKAFGLRELTESGIVSAEDAKIMARNSFNDEILPIFADSKGANHRDAMRRHLNYQERVFKGQLTKKPKVSLPRPPKNV